MSGSREEQVYDVFQSISRRYDRMNDLISLGMHRRWKRELTGKVEELRPRRVLDVCCGTGDVSIAIARTMPGAQVVGLDFSPEMLDVAGRRLEAAGLKNVEFLQGNALALPFADGGFDCAVISFGLRNLSDYGRAVGELARVVRPGGGVFCLDSFYPQTPLVRPFYTFYFKYLVTLLGGQDGAQYRWLYTSTRKFLAPQALAELLAAKGLERCGYRTYLFGAAALHQGRKPTV
jgi:demethylmenaquinone methyltransferase/2-methoxy-6-polyprenyl-1,4-benzoquinol methylase